MKTSDGAVSKTSFELLGRPHIMGAGSKSEHHKKTRQKLNPLVKFQKSHNTPSRVVASFCIMEKREHRLHPSMVKVSRYIVRKSNVPINWKMQSVILFLPFFPLCLFPLFQESLWISFTISFLSSIPLLSIKKKHFLYRYNILQSPVLSLPYNTVRNKYFMKMLSKTSNI